MKTHSILVFMVHFIHGAVNRSCIRCYIANPLCGWLKVESKIAKVNTEYLSAIAQHTTGSCVVCSSGIFTMILVSAVPHIVHFVAVCMYDVCHNDVISPTMPTPSSWEHCHIHISVVFRCCVHVFHIIYRTTTARPPQQTTT